MANFEGIPLFGNVNTSGVLYPLRTRPEFSRTVRLSTDVEVEVHEGVQAVIVRGLTTANYEETSSIAPELANQGLDIFTLKGNAPLALMDVEDGHVAWWSEGRDTVIRFWCSTTITAAFRATGVVRGPDGQVKPPDIETTPQWQESMRYYRMSELTDDLFDAFRNIYLSLESLLSSLHPKRQKPNGHEEGDFEWFKRALKEEENSVDLRRFSTSSSGNPAHDIANELHNQIRNRIFHAKDSHSSTKAKSGQSLLPQRIFDRTQVAEAKDRFGHLYLALAEKAFNALFPTGGTGLSKEAARHMLGSITHGWNIAFTGDPTPANSSDTEVSPGGEPFTTIPGRGFTDARGDEYVAVIADVRPSDSSDGVSSVGRMATVSQNGELGAIYSLDGRLDLEGFDRCEFVFSFHAAGQRTRKTRYAT
ncbi:hypothetical protein [Streptomyces sp. IB201691-2A2]|uniref:hypothetical protein n=1 Tax=Streptomyces sp. IB201691-2A2 TaxID=2561920 RepID=UPI001180EC98|nr:hypothetical protein [Streptomyces sp. IB201691-2A2]TRO68211.1 hypothetical protein E4K73_05030 [Streptomyces sp. IB201691-2A2]